MGTKRLLGLLLAGIIVSCAQQDQLQPRTNNVWMISNDREVAIGEEVAREVEREYPVYEDKSLAAYVDEVGQTMAAVSDRNDIEYHFRVLDTPIVNAFATPGGHIYITRGMLGYLDDEAELAGVLGHEVGHVAARHSAKAIQNATMASIGMTVLAVVFSDQVNNDILTGANIAAGLIFLGYSRGDEHQADLLGTKYLHRAGYDMNGMTGVMEGLLEAQEREPMSVEQFLMSHPLTPDRIDHINSWIPRIPEEDEWEGTPPGTAVRNAERFERLAAPHAIYGGEAELKSLLENLRVGLIRGQTDLVMSTISPEYSDGRGRNRDDFEASVRNFFAKASSVHAVFNDVEVEPGRNTASARLSFSISVRDTDGVVHENEGNMSVEMVKPEPHQWGISSIEGLPI